MSSRYYALKEIRARGWSLRLIETVLGEPDKLVRIHRRRSSAPARLWSRERVEAAEKSSPDFIGYQPKRAAASARSKKTAERKRGELRADIDRLAVTVHVIPHGEAIERGIRNWQGRS